MSYYAINDLTKETQEMFHSGWWGDTANVCIKSTHLALANQFIHEKYQGKPYNVLNVNKKIQVEKSHHQVKGEKYCYTLKLI
jgi:hypothetical protein